VTDKPDSHSTSERDLSNTLTAVLLLSVERMENDVLAAMNLALQWQGCIPAGNISFKAATDANLVDETGAPVAKEELIRAVSYEINRRMSAGTFK
jgi:hypothetical protein